MAEITNENRGQFNKGITLPVFILVKTACKVQIVNTRIQEKKILTLKVQISSVQSHFHLEELLDILMSCCRNHKNYC